MKEQLQLSKWIDGQLTEDEEKNIPDIDLYKKIKKYSTELEAPNLDKNKIKQRIASANKSNKSTSLFLKIAAILALLLSASSVLFYLGKVSLSAGNSVSYVYLPDQSKVHLQEHSQLNYNRYFWLLNRDVDLIGKAFFEVEKGEKFTVNTKHGEVAVLGTKFSVQTNTNNFIVKCFEGKVAVSYKNKKEILLPNKSVEIDTEKERVAISKFNYNQPIWAFNEVKFNSIAFKDLVQIISEKFSIQIDDSALQKPSAFTGTLELNNLEESLAIIASTYSVRIKQINKNNYIFVEDELE